MGKNLKLESKKVWLIAIKMIVALSGTYLSLVFNAYGQGYFVSAFNENTTMAFFFVCLLGGFVLAGLIVILFKLDFLEKLYDRLLKKPKPARIILVIYSLICGFFYVSRFNHHVTERIIHHGETLWTPLPPLWALVLPLALMYVFFLTVLIDFVVGLFKSFSRYELVFFVVFTVIAISYIDVLYNSTDVYHKHFSGNGFMYSYDTLPDAIYLLDPFYIWSYYQYPLQPNFAMPLLLFTIPLSRFDGFWEVIVRQIVQVELLLLAIIALSRMVSKNIRVRIIALLIFSFSYPNVILAMIVERRLFALVFLVLAIYHNIYLRGVEKNKGEDALWLSVASGMIVTNVYVFLLAIEPVRAGVNIKNWLKSTLKNVFLYSSVFVFITTFFGKIGGLVDLRAQVNAFNDYGWLFNDYSFGTRLTHFMYFIASCLFPAPSGIRPATGNQWWQTEPSMESPYFWLGIIISAFAVLGFILNYKNRFAQVSFAGILMSTYFILMSSLNIGENAVVLSTLFYSWAVISLIIMGIDKLFVGTKAKTRVLAGLAGVCLVWSVIEAVRLYQFGLEIHPV